MNDPHTERLRRAGLRATAPRLRVLQTLTGRDRPVTHAELAAALQGMDPVTLYRVLDSFAASRIVHRILGLDGTYRYCPPRAAAGCPGGHVHFYCMSCGATFCLEDQPMPRVTAPPGATVEARQFLASGRCPDCAT